jgi:pimeloyl-ACP methyl ester carboxylesterase
MVHHAPTEIEVNRGQLIMPSIETATSTIYFTDHRKADPQYAPLVLLHGAGGSHQDWPPQLRRSAETTALAVDLPGHGKSPDPGRDSVSDYAADVVALLDALEIPKAIIAGHSMGGAIAQTIAVNHSERVAGLILVGTGAKLGVHPHILDRVLTEPEAVFELLKDWIWGPATENSMRETGYAMLLLAATPQVIHGDYTACNNFDNRQRIPEITCPTLVISGTEDKMTPLKFGAYLQENIAGAKLVTVEGGGHMMALEQPQFVADAIRDWLGKS